MHRRPAVLVAVLGVLTGVSACAPVVPIGTGSTADVYGATAPPGALRDGGDLVIALSAEPDALDPATSRSLYSRYIFHTMCEKLYDVDQDAAIVPQLATALPAVSDGGRTVTIPVRAGVTFGDGTPFNAAAVKASIERELTLPTSGRKSELGPVTSVEAPTPTSVVIHLSEPFAPLTAALTDRAGMVVSPTASAKLGDDFGTAPVCVGPFRFEGRVPQSSITVVKDPHYYDAADVHLDTITYRIITDASIRAANLKSGDVQVADSLSSQDVGSVAATSDLSVLQSQSLGYQGLTFNLGNVDGVGQPAGTINRPEAKDPRIRRAFEASIDRDVLNQIVFAGTNTVACSPISPQSELSSAAAQVCPPHDLATAHRLLREAGVATPYPIALEVSNNPDSLRLAQVIQAMVKEGGFDLQIRPVEYAALLDLQDKGDFALLQLGWSGRIDPDANITSFVGSGGSLNVSGYHDPTLDALLTQARRTSDVTTRRALYGKVVTRLQQTDPLIYLYRQRNLTGVSARVAGVQVFPDGVIRVARAGFVGS